MANFDAYPSAGLPLSGSEKLVLSQGGATVNVAVTDLGASLPAGGAFVATGATAAITPQNRAAFSLTPYDFGAKGDGQFGLDTVSTTSGNPTVTTTIAAFTAADVGKQLYMRNLGAGAGLYAGTILAVNSAHSINVSPAPGVTASNQANTETLWGHDDTAAFSALLAATAANGGALAVPPGRYLTSGGHVLTNGQSIVGPGVASGRVPSALFAVGTPATDATIFHTDPTKSLFTGAITVAGSTTRLSVVRGLTIIVVNFDQTTPIAGPATLLQLWAAIDLCILYAYIAISQTFNVDGIRYLHFHYRGIYVDGVTVNKGLRDIGYIQRVHSNGVSWSPVPAEATFRGLNGLLLEIGANCQGLRASQLFTISALGMLRVSSANSVGDTNNLQIIVTDFGCENCKAAITIDSDVVLYTDIVVSNGYISVSPRTDGVYLVSMSGQSYQSQCGRLILENLSFRDAAGTTFVVINNGLTLIKGCTFYGDGGGAVGVQFTGNPTGDLFGGTAILDGNLFSTMSRALSFASGAGGCVDLGNNVFTQNGVRINGTPSTNGANYWSGGGLYKLITIEASYTVPNIFNRATVEVNAAIPVSVNPGNALLPGRSVKIKDISGNAHLNPITVAETIDGAVNPVIATDYGGMEILANGTVWNAI